MSNNLIALQNKFLGHGTTAYDLLSRMFADQGHISDADIDRVAREHNLPPAHLRATAKFYEQLSHTAPAARVLRVCNGEACRAAGCDRVLGEFVDALGVAAGSTSEAGVRVEHVTCVGYCGKGPNVMVDGRPLSLAKPGAVATVLADLAGGPPHALAEPSNALYPPRNDHQPCVIMRRFGQGAASLAKARELGAYLALEKAVRTMNPTEVLAEVEKSKLRGRGGAGFPAAIKWKTVAANEAADGSGRKFVVVNFDEGDAGSYIDKEIVEQDPHGQLEGVLLAAYACGAHEAIIYARFEYPRARAVLDQAIAEATAAGLIGKPLFDSAFRCDVRVVPGQGAYICGEETSLLRSIEGLPALVSIRPPFPAESGLWGCPTAVNNVETLQAIPWIVSHGGHAYAAYGHEDSRGTKAVSLNHRVRRPGMYEVEFGITLREIIFELAGGMAQGQVFKGVQVGGPLGGILPERLLDTPLEFEAMAKAGGIVGHAGMVVYSQEDDLMVVGRGLMHFCAIESCGKCFPCRIGAVRGTELMDQMMREGATQARITLLQDLCETMKFGSLCAMGSMTPLPIESILEHFPEDLAGYPKP
ncbi:MAG: NADH-ubiquinone oxidoreductase-F iron-sulfur binding region domain-containing protein [Nannocystaceae bacterium]